LNEEALTHGGGSVAPKYKKKRGGVRVLYFTGMERGFFVEENVKRTEK